MRLITLRLTLITFTLFAMGSVLALAAGKAVPTMGEMAYISSQSAVTRVYLMDVQRHISLPVDRPYVNDCCLTWSPDGKLLTMVVDMSSDGSTDIFTSDFHSPPLRLTNVTGADLYPAFSPDGRYIAYTGYGYGNPQIYLMNADGTEPRQLTGPRALVNLNPRPVWSTDGRSVLFSDFGNVDSLFTVPADCNDPCDTSIHTDFQISGAELMTTNFVPLDATRILLAAFSRSREGGYGIYVMDTQKAKAPERLTWNADISSPTVAVYGRWVAFVSGETDTSSDDEQSYLYILDSSCIGTDEGCASVLRSITPNVDTNDNLSWSPDGRWLAFVKVEGRHSQLYMLDTTCLQTGQDCDPFIHTLSITSLRYIRPSWRPTMP
ncbi:MAG: hypothetical protein LCI00_30700 [Chloroflexi bacterium]|nr:hypothetical protein [Chloroflexota bacterium]MCC6894763.1 PD40 domain-containing protein [Anaerolineae bacterium]